MKTNKIAKIQHYVTQFLLKQFTIGKKPQVWVFDKTTGKVICVGGEPAKKGEDYVDGK